MKTLKAYLRQIAQARADALAMMESEGFRFTTQLGKANLTETERWEKLAFTLYTEIIEISEKAEAALAALNDIEPAKADDAEWQRRHS